MNKLRTCAKWLLLVVVCVGLSCASVGCGRFKTPDESTWLSASEFDSMEKAADDELEALLEEVDRIGAEADDGSDTAE